MKLTRDLLSAPLILILAACGDAGDSTTASEFGDAWPFIVDSGELRCVEDDGSEVALFVYQETEYAINGFAQERGYADVEPLLKDHPAIPGAKTNVSLSVVRAALEKCG